MIGPYFSLSAETCQLGDCGRDAVRFGYCDEHYPQQMELRHRIVVEKGLARDPYPCFDSYGDWREYEVLATQAPGASGAKDRERRERPVSPCADCTHEFRSEMAAAGRCIRPETVFIMRTSNGDTSHVGINADRPRQWQLAIAGTLGPVLGRPTDAVILETERRIRGAQ